MDVAAVFLPLLGSAIAGILVFLAPEDKTRRKRIDHLAQLASCSGLILAALAAGFVFKDVVIDGQVGVTHLATWITSGSFELSWALHWDTLSAVMVLMVTVVSAAIHVYSVGYMHHDPSIPRFMSYISLFTFFMLMLVTANNLVQLFFGWEGVGLTSYLLIGFWYTRPSAAAAAIKAFLVNRIGDFGFILGIFATYVLFDSIQLDAIFAAAPDYATASISAFGFEGHALTVICVLLFVGAMGKSAQIGLHTWLPDAMEGPTPVSALIHAATMVTAGIFMVARLSPLFEYSDTALALVTIVGALTAFMAATIACVQNDIKRVIAYSTCSQLGYMFFACGVSAYSAGMFHLVTHAFFKSLLFLGAGSVIHAMSDEQDMRQMGGLWKMIPVTYVLMWIGSLALGGIWPFAGYFSKDVILESAFAAHTAVGDFAFWIGIFVAFLTAFYSWRLLFMTFHGTPRGGEELMAHVKESPAIMLAPLFVLAAGASFGGYLWFESFVGTGASEFWNGALLILPGHSALTDAHHVPGWVKHLPLAAGGAGIALAFVLYIMAPGAPLRIAQAAGPLHRFLMKKWYFDELYDAVFVRPAFRIGRGLWKKGDGAVIDGVGPDGIAALTVRLARRARQLQTGFVYHYAFAMLIGVAAFVSWYFIGMVG